MSSSTPAAVLVPVFTGPGDGLRIVLIRRVDRGLHAGEIGLPGGKRAAGDATLEATAIRETAEEIGVLPADVQILGALPAVHTITTGFLIHPFLARVRRPAAWQPQAREIAEVIEVAVDDLLLPSARTRESIDCPGVAEPIAADCLRVGDIRIWGATYRILQAVLSRLERGLEPAGPAGHSPGGSIPG